VLLHWQVGDRRLIEAAEVVMGLALIALVANSFWFRFPISSKQSLITLFFLSALYAAALSSDWTRKAIDQVDAKQTPPATITTSKLGVYSGHILMSGERGILSYHPDTKQIVFTKADEIKKIERPLH
jgi:hypothetical protein